FFVASLISPFSPTSSCRQEPPLKFRSRIGRLHEGQDRKGLLIGIPVYFQENTAHSRRRFCSFVDSLDDTSPFNNLFQSFLRPKHTSRICLRYPNSRGFRKQEISRHGRYFTRNRNVKFRLPIHNLSGPKPRSEEHTS